jgi:hypothetical protein
MANLLDLPAELFQMVIHELVDTASEGVPSYRFGIGRVWVLRGVCRSFAAQIEREIFSQRPKKFYSQYHDVSGLVHKCLPRYMMQASRKLGSVNERFFTRLQRMAEYIVEQVDCETPEQRTDIFERTYSGLNTLLNGIEKDSLITPQLIRWALEMDDLASLDTILRQLETRPLSEQIVLTQPRSMFFVSDCIETTLRWEDLTAAQMLLDYYEKNLPCPPKDTYNQWISNTCAVRFFRLPNLRAVLGFDTGGKKRIGRDTLVIACTRGNSAAVHEVLQHIGDINKGTVLTAPIFIAVRSGRRSAIEACLHAGADIDLLVASNIRTLDKTHITPLDIAIYRHDVPVASLLIEAGATIPHISQWPTHKRTYRLLRAAASKLTEVELLYLQHIKHISKGEIAALQY